jgi:hypothetical protein
VIVSNMLGLSDTETVMAENSAAPAWAATAVASLQQEGLFETNDAAQLLTRREAAELLYQVRLNAEENTLLSWAKED